MIMVFSEVFSAVKRKFGESARATKSYSEESLVVQHKNFEKLLSNNLWIRFYHQIANSLNFTAEHTENAKAPEKHKQ